MNKKYMDFVPSSAVKTPAKGVVTKKPASQKPAPKVVRAAKPRVVREELIVREDGLEVDAETFSLKREPNYGVVEDFRPKFVKTEVAKRPLSRAAKVAAKKAVRPVEKHVEKPEKTEEKAEDRSKMKIPKSPFINQTKVAKRPLSKNIYERTIAPTEEKSTGPVTIISKPEKDAKVGRVVAIILAIILGAAAGTVAFLLLPK